MKKNISIMIGMCLFFLLFSGCGEESRSYFEEAGEAEEDTETLIESVKETEEAEKTECYVHICGAVANPGVYQLPAGSRIFEAVQKAGGLLETACEESINQAEEIIDGQMIKILTAEEFFEQETLIVTESEVSDGRIDLNTADASELMTLPGIGEAKAMSILSYREEKGAFSSAEEIMNITGIKEGVYSKIKDYITVH